MQVIYVVGWMVQIVKVFVVKKRRGEKYPAQTQCE